MNKLEIYNALWTLTKERYDACKAEAATVDKNYPTERGALQLQAGIYHAAITAGLLSGTDTAVELMSKRFQRLIQRFPDIADSYRTLPEDQKELMEISLYPEAFMRANFYDAYQTELEMAEKEGDPQMIFKAKIKKEVLDDILNLWRTFRMQNGLFSFAFESREAER